MATEPRENERKVYHMDLWESKQFWNKWKFYQYQGIYSFHFILQWILLSSLFAGIPFYFATEHIEHILQSDKSGILPLSLTLFSFALLKNFINICILQKEWYQVQNVKYSKHIRYSDLSKNSYFTRHLNNLKHIHQSARSVSQDHLIPILMQKLKIKETPVGLLSNLLITLGLIGTIIGLIMTIGGLGQALGGADGDTSELLNGLRTSISGMGVAFYTTLAGAVLGGVILRVLHQYALMITAHLVSEIAEVVEVYYLPALGQKANSENSSPSSQD